MQATTALRKISSLRKRIKGIQGGQGAGKTYSILQLITNHASSVPDREIYVASHELSKMRITVIKDFVKILRAFGIYNHVQITGLINGQPLCIFPNRSFIQFLGLDKADIGKGLRSHVMFVNEANKINFDTYRELTSRANQIFIDFNPNNLFWFHTEIATRNDCDFIKLTFLDNECLGKEEKGEILRYKELGYKADNTGIFAVNEKGELVVINQYWANMWRVYGLGEVGQVEGRIYNWKPCSLSDYLKINKTTYYGVDWGKVDPFAVTELKYHDGDLYVRQKNYASENEIERNMQPELLKSIRGGESINSTGQRHDGLVSYVFNQIGIPKNSNVICDNNRPNKILSLRNAGWEYTVAVGGKVDLVNRISTLSGLNIYYTDDSKNIESEQMNYCYDKDRNGVLLESPIDQNNHSIDSIAYGVQWMFKQGIIKNI